MTKKQLLKKLEKVSDETEIIISSDSEGNKYNKLGEVYSAEGLKFLIEDHEIALITEASMSKYEITEREMSEKEYNKLKDCVVLYP